jgi:hypothetical protein
MSEKYVTYVDMIILDAREKLIEHGLSEDESEFLLKMIYDSPDWYYEWWNEKQDYQNLTYKIEDFEKFFNVKDYQEMFDIWENLEKVNYSFTFNEDFKYNTLRRKMGLRLAYPY